MAVESIRFALDTRGRNDVLDLTSRVADAVSRARPAAGTVTVFVPGSTAGITTIEFEPGLVTDLGRALERLVPAHAAYEHNRYDDNGHAHVMASLIDPSVTVPFADRALLLGTWQQIVLVDFDTHPRRREVICQIVGE